MTLLRCHRHTDCQALNVGMPCPVHAPTDHPMRSWPQTWDPERGFGRVCEHGVEHPDPDDFTLVWHDDCCGCCGDLD